MNGKKLGLFALVILFSATILVPALLTGIASADCGASVCNNCPAEYRCSYDGDLLRCSGCALPDYDRSAVPDRGNWAGEYSCNLCGCSWNR
jgi:hypothetical protein